MSTVMALILPSITGGRRSAGARGDCPVGRSTRVPVEDKPLYVDFAGVSAVEALARSVRRTLRDAAGRRHTSELRVIALRR